MKRLATLPFVVAAAFAMAAGSVTPTDIVKKPEQFDNKVVTVTGVVKKFKAKTSKAGNDYSTFQLTSGKDSVNVFTHGKFEKPLADGTKVEVKGKFLKEKKVGSATYKNEVDASGKKGEKPNVKILK